MPPIAADQVSYADLYARWRRTTGAPPRSTCRSIAISGRRYSPISSVKSALWTYSLFFHGEDLVTDNLSPFIYAAPREEQKYFLATQQVDEARHAVLFARFVREVVGVAASVGSALEETRPKLTWGFRKVFERLDRMADELRHDRSRPKLAQEIRVLNPPG